MLSKEYFSLIVAAVGPLLGVTLGWFLGQIEFSLRKSRERRESGSFALFHLLQIRSLLGASHRGQKFVQAYVSKVEAALQDLANLDFQRINMISEHLNSLLRVGSYHLHPRDLQKEFREAIRSLAIFKPFLSADLFRYDRALEISAILDTMEQQTESLLANEAISLEDLEQAFLMQKELMQRVRKQAISEYCSELDEAILFVAKSLTWEDRKSAKHWVRHHSLESDAQINSELESIIHNLDQNLHSVLFKPNQGDHSA